MNHKGKMKNAKATFKCARHYTKRRVREKRVERKSVLGDQGAGRTTVEETWVSVSHEAPSCSSPVNEPLEAKT